jgi:hypothetical protein
VNLPAHREHSTLLLLLGGSRSLGDRSRLDLVLLLLDDRNGLDSRGGGRVTLLGDGDGGDGLSSLGSGLDSLDGGSLLLNGNDGDGLLLLDDDGLLDLSRSRGDGGGGGVGGRFGDGITFGSSRGGGLVKVEGLAEVQASEGVASGGDVVVLGGVEVVDDGDFGGRS